MFLFWFSVDSGLAPAEGSSGQRHPTHLDLSNCMPSLPRHMIFSPTRPDSPILSFIPGSSSDSPVSYFYTFSWMKSNLIQNLYYIVYQLFTRGDHKTIDQLTTYFHMLISCNHVCVFVVGLWSLNIFSYLKK